jgi:hypothetical protein
MGKKIKYLAPMLLTLALIITSSCKQNDNLSYYYNANSTGAGTGGGNYGCGCCQNNNNATAPTCNSTITILDAQGAPVPYATVTLYEATTRTYISDANGQVVATQLTDGQYVIKVVVAGYANKLELFTVANNECPTVDVTLTPASGCSAVDVQKLIISQFEDPYNYGRTNDFDHSRLPRQFHQSDVNVIQSGSTNVWNVFVSKDSLDPQLILRPLFVIAPLPNHSCAPQYLAHIRNVVALYSSLKGNVPHTLGDIQPWSYDAQVPKSETTAAPAATTLYGSETVSIRPKNKDNIFTKAFTSADDSPLTNEICIDQLIQGSQWGYQNLQQYQNYITVFAVSFEMECK